MTHEPYDVVVVPFPFTDRLTSKRRPALVLSDREVLNEEVGQAALAMITSRKNPPWPLDVPIEELDTAGLPSPSLVRMKLFTLDQQLTLRKAGRLGPEDERNVRAILGRVLGFPTPN